MVVVVAPNPSLDKTVIIPDFALGQIFRPSEVLTLAGGKGFNFARALKTLGHLSVVVAPLGRQQGQFFLELARQEALQWDVQYIEGEVRTCLTVIDPAHQNRSTEIYEKGPVLQVADWEKQVELTASHFGETSYLAVCGSFPPGIPQAGLAGLVRRAKGAGKKVLLDTFGPQLDGVLELSPDLLKINQFEAGSLVGRPLETAAEALEAAQELQQRGAQAVVITLGKVGAVGRTAGGETFGWSSPKVEAAFSTGSGDSLLAGLVSGLLEGQGLAEAVRRGVAAGAANTLEMGAGRFERGAYANLLEAILPLRL